MGLNVIGIINYYNNGNLYEESTVHIIMAKCITNCFRCISHVPIKVLDKR